MRYENGKIKTTYKVANNCSYKKIIPTIGYNKFFHFSLFSRVIIFMGVPEKSKIFLNVFSRKRS